MSKPKVLVTGFEPFGGSAVNPSAEVVRLLAFQEMVHIELYPRVLPVDAEAAPRALIQSLDETQPDAVICLGEERGCVGLSVERVAVNLLDFRQPDNAGNMIADRPIVPDGPAAYFTTLPARAIVEAIRAEGIPADLSLSAGTYLCNQIAYVALHHLSTAGRAHVPAGFIHLPALPEQVTQKPAASMTAETAANGVVTALGVVVSHLQSPLPK